MIKLFRKLAKLRLTPDYVVTFQDRAHLFSSLRDTFDPVDSLDT